VEAKAHIYQRKIITEFMIRDQSLDVLNTLVEINNDRIQGYQRASAETEEADLKQMFARFISRSKECKEELGAEIERWGGTASESTKTGGKFFRIWMEVKVALLGNDRLTILDSCEYGEEMAVFTYERALKRNSDILTFEQEKLLIAQHKRLKADYEKIKRMREELMPTS
jgi:uncharacterized protein (TIGR02284 family)